MSLTVESAASSTIGPCTGLVPMNGTSMACYLDRQKLQQHQSAVGWTLLGKRSVHASVSSIEPPAAENAMAASPSDAHMQP